MLSIVPGNAIRGGFAKSAPRNSVSSAIDHGRRAARRRFRRWIPAIWMVALFLFTAGCGIDLSSPPVASSDPTDLTGTWVGTIEDSNTDLYETEVIFNSQGQMSAFTIFKPLATDTNLTGTVEGLDGSDKFFKFTLSDLKEGGLVADSDFSHAGIIIDGFSAGVLQKTPPTVTTQGNGPYDLGDISEPIIPGGLTWTGSIMRVEITDGVITNVIGKSSTVTINDDGSFTGNDEINGDIQNTTGGKLIDPTPGNLNSDLGRFTGNWEKVADPTTFGPVVILITPDKNFLGSFSCVDPDRTLDVCDFHLWRK